MMTADSTRRIALWQWTIGLTLALVTNHFWPPAAMLFCLVTTAAGIAGFAVPVLSRLNSVDASYVKISRGDALLYTGLLLLPPAIDLASNGILCPPASRGIWSMVLVTLGFVLPGRWYDRMREFSKHRQQRAIEDLSRKETVGSIFRAVFAVGGAENFKTMSPKRQWVYVVSFGLMALAAASTIWAAALGEFVHWAPMLTAPFAAIAVFAALIAAGVMSLEAIDKVALQKELRTAHDVQMGLMPTSDPSLVGFDISGLCKPAEEVGGDYFDYVWLNEEKTRLGIAIADVSGKAMKAAMTAVMTSGMVYRELGSNETPKTILRKINRPMYFKTDKRIFTAMSFAVTDTVTKSLAFSNAGQMQPLLRRNGQIESLKVEGARLPLGMAEDVEYNELTISLQSGDVVVFYTDGVPEAMNAKNEMFGFERLEALVKESVADLTAKQVAAKIVDKVAEFAGSAKQHDDMTVVVVKVL